MPGTIGFLILFCLLLPLPAFADELRIITEHSPPANYLENGQAKGFAVEVVKDIQRRLGDKTRLEFLPWARGYKLGVTRPDTMLFSTTRTPQREDLFQWIGPTMTPGGFSMPSRGRSNP